MVKFVEVVNKYCCAKIMLCYRSHLVSWYEAQCWADKLINANNLTCRGHCPSLFLVIYSLALRWFAM